MPALVRRREEIVGVHENGSPDFLDRCMILLAQFSEPSREEGIEPRRSDHRNRPCAPGRKLVDDSQCITELVELPEERIHRLAIMRIQPDEHAPSGPLELCEGTQAAPGIRRMMKNAEADDRLHRCGGDRRMKRIRLNQMKAGNIAVAPEGGSYRIAQVEGKHLVATPGKGRSPVGGTAAGIEDPGLLVTGWREHGPRYEVCSFGHGESIEDIFLLESLHAAGPLKIEGGAGVSTYCRAGQKIRNTLKDRVGETSVLGVKRPFEDVVALGPSCLQDKTLT